MFLRLLLEYRKNVNNNLKMGHPRSLFNLFSPFQYRWRKVHKKIADDWIRTAALLCRKRPLYQPSHNHCPWKQNFYPQIEPNWMLIYLVEYILRHDVINSYLSCHISWQKFAFLGGNFHGKELNPLQQKLHSPLKW